MSAPVLRTVSGHHFQMYGATSCFAGVLLQDFEKRGAKATRAMARLDIDVVDKRLATAMLDAIAMAADAITADFAIDACEKHLSVGKTGFQHVHERRDAFRRERMVVFVMKSARKPHD